MTIRAKKSTLTVMLCCNDHRNGMDTGVIEQISINDGDTLVSLDGRAKWKLKANGLIKIGRRQYPCESFREWTGNWCWDSVELTSAVVAELLNDLRETGRWSPSEWAVWLGDKWKSGERFTAEDFSLRKDGVSCG